MMNDNRENLSPINPEDEFIVCFEESVDFRESRKILAEVFNKHGKGEIAAPMPGSSTVLIRDIDWDIIEEFRESPAVSAIGPNRPIYPA